MNKKLLPLFLLGISLGGCSLQAPPSPTPSASEEAPIPVTTTFYPWAYFLREVGGDRVRVTSVVPNGVEPHDFEPGPGDIATIRSARVFVYNGAGIDPWAEKAVAELSDAPVLTVRAADSTPLLDAVEDGHGHGEEGHEEEHEDHAETHQAGFDPHFWLDPVAVRTVVERIELALRTVDREHEASYRSNADRVRAELDALDREYRAGLQSCRIRKAVTGHAAFAYLAKRYGFQQVPVSGLSPENEPSLSRLREITDTIRADGIRFVFLETLASPRVAQTVARETGAQTLVFNPLEGLTPEEVSRGETYFTVMRANLDNLRRGMECQ